MPKTARDIMSTTVIVVRPEQTLAEAARLMLEHRISTLPVVSPEGELVGIITHSDFQVRGRLLPFSQREVPEVLHHLTSWQEMEESYREAMARRVREVMSHPVHTVAPDTPVAEVAALMLRHNIKRVPVVEGGRIVGLISRHDFLKLMLEAADPQE